MRTRKTRDEYQLHIDYGHGHGFEEVVAEATMRAAREQQKCYRENEPGYRSKIVKKRIKIEGGA